MSDATWDGFVSRYWDDPAGVGPAGSPTNWNPGVIPTGTASFPSFAYQYAIFFKTAGLHSIATMQFSSGPSYLFGLSNDTLALTGTGIVNGQGQTFNLAFKSNLSFSSIATADYATITASNGSSIFFTRSSTAGHATITMSDGATPSGSILFSNFASASAAQINVASSSAYAFFQNSSSLATSTITLSNDGHLSLSDNAHGGSAHINIQQGTMLLGGSSTLRADIISNSGKVYFNAGSWAGSAVVHTLSGGYTRFSDTSAGGRASFAIDAGGTLDISAHAGYVYVGELTGFGTLNLGSNNLFIFGSANGPAPVDSFNGTVIGSGHIIVGKASTQNSTVTYGGQTSSTSATLSVNQGTLELLQGSTWAGGVSFTGLKSGPSIIKLDANGVLSGPILDMAKDNAVDLKFHAFNANDPIVFTPSVGGHQGTSTSAALAGSGGTLTIGTGATQISLTLGGVHTPSEFKLTSDGAGGTLISDLGTSLSVASGLAALGGNASYGRVDFLDSAANVLAALDGLEARAANLASITFTDATPTTFTLTPTQSVADHEALAMIASPVTLKVTATSAGRNVLEGGPGNDTLTGAASGLNTALFSGAAPDYTVTASGASITVADGVAHRDATDSLTNIQRLQFSNVILAFDTAGNAGEAYRLYQAAFARTPDQDGVSYWVSQVDKGMGLRDVATAFLGSDEFLGIYGANPSVQALVTGFYTNVLGRAPDTTGLSYWVGQVQGGLSTADLLLSFSDSSENKANVAPDVQNGIALTLSFFG